MLLLGCWACSAGPEERISKIYELKADPTLENRQRMRTMLTDHDRDVRATAVNALVSLGVEDAGEIVRAALADEDGFVRATAAKLAGEIGDPADAEALARMLHEDSHPVVRQRAAEALTAVGGPVAVRGLVAGLLDPIEGVRLAAVKGVRKLDPSAAKAELSKLLLEDPVWEVQVQAARALGETGDPRVVPVLEEALGSPNEFVRGAAANALRIRQEVARGKAVAGGKGP